MSLKKFNPYANMRIDKVKAHHMYLKKKPKEYYNDAMMSIDEEDQYDNKVPWEIANVKHLCAGKAKPRIEKEKIFDVLNDGKPLKVKKESKKEKDTRAFYMMDGKKYHEIGGKAIFD